MELESELELGLELDRRREEREGQKSAQTAITPGSRFFLLIWVGGLLLEAQPPPGSKTRKKTPPLQVSITVHRSQNSPILQVEQKDWVGQWARVTGTGAWPQAALCPSLLGSWASLKEAF